MMLVKNWISNQDGMVDFEPILRQFDPIFYIPHCIKDKAATKYSIQL